MIYLLTGDNSYQIEQHIARLLASVSAVPRRIDGTSLTLANLPELMMGTTLFGAAEPLVIKGLSENSAVWQTFVDWIEKIDDNHLVMLVEPKLDKRTKAYKTLIKKVTVIEAKQWTDRDQTLAAEWLRTRAKSLKLSVSPAQVNDMVRRALVPGDKPGSFFIDQMRLHSALSAIGPDTEVTDDMIDAVMPKATRDTIFDLLEVAASGERRHVQSILAELRAREDGSKVFAIIASQWVQLVSVAVSEGPATQLASELGMHPFVIQKLSRLAGRFTRSELRQLTHLCAGIDTGMKHSEIAPWDGVDRFVIEIAAR